MPVAERPLRAMLRKIRITEDALNAKTILKCLPRHNIEKHILLVKGNVGNSWGSREKV